MLSGWYIEIITIIYTRDGSEKLQLIRLNILLHVFKSPKGLHTNCYISATAVLTGEYYDDVIMSTMASPITSLTVVYSIVYSDADQRKHQSSASLAFVWGIHRDRWIPHTNDQLRGKCFHLMTSSWKMIYLKCLTDITGWICGKTWVFDFPMPLLSRTRISN